MNIAHGLRPELAAESSRAIIVYVIGHAASSSGDPDGFWSGMFDLGQSGGELPALERTAEVWRTPPAEQFRRGLELLLDGVGERAS